MCECFLIWATDPSHEHESAGRILNVNNTALDLLKKSVGVGGIKENNHVYQPMLQGGSVSEEAIENGLFWKWQSNEFRDAEFGSLIVVPQSQLNSDRNAYVNFTLSQTRAENCCPCLLYWFFLFTREKAKAVGSQNSRNAHKTKRIYGIDFDDTLYQPVEDLIQQQAWQQLGHVCLLFIVQDFGFVIRPSSVSSIISGTSHFYSAFDCSPLKLSSWFGHRLLFAGERDSIQVQRSMACYFAQAAAMR
ncbi:hypothetical protein D5086_027181 [Populus alba]|uniref:Uncharacterized protein n=1 Tax=Populus alba TaxID=43335 RepID=A0ACC4B5G1_POPAL